MISLFNTFIYLFFVFIFLYIITDLIEKFRDDSNITTYLKYRDNISKESKFIELKISFNGYDEDEKKEILKSFSQEKLTNVIKKVDRYKVE